MGIKRPTVEDLRNNLTDFATLFRWSVTVTPPTGIGNFDDFNLRCESADQPKMTNAPVEVTIRGLKVKQPGISSYSHTQTLTVVETIDATVMSAIREWREAIWATGTGVSKNNVSGNLKGKVLLERLDAEDNVIWRTELRGVYLEDYEAGGQLGNSGNEAVKPTLTFSYDYFDDSEGQNLGT